jgi:uncharacterized RDD family membrane protein YckC
MATKKKVKIVKTEKVAKEEKKEVEVVKEEEPIAQPKEKTNDLFLKRFIAYIIDVCLISCLAALIAMPFLDNTSIDKLNKQSSELTTNYLNKKITLKQYTDESSSITYELARKDGLTTILTILFSILYFVLFQYYFNGQTLGKKLMKIKVVSNDDEKVSMNQLVIRSSLIDTIIFDLLIFGFTVFSSETIYITSVGTIQFIAGIVIIVSGFMVIIRNDSRGLHDLVANTKVVRADTVKEKELCEN